MTGELSHVATHIEFVLFFELNNPVLIGVTRLGAELIKQTKLFYLKGSENSLFHRMQ